MSILLAAIGITTAVGVTLVSAARVLAAHDRKEDIVYLIVKGSAQSVLAITGAVFLVGFDAITMPLLRSLFKVVDPYATAAASAASSPGGQGFAWVMVAIAIAASLVNLGIALGRRE